MASGASEPPPRATRPAPLVGAQAARYLPVEEWVGVGEPAAREGYAWVSASLGGGGASKHPRQFKSRWCAAHGRSLLLYRERGSREPLHVVPLTYAQVYLYEAREGEGAAWHDAEDEDDEGYEGSGLRNIVCVRHPRAALEGGGDHFFVLLKAASGEDAAGWVAALLAGTMAYARAGVAGAIKAADDAEGVVQALADKLGKREWQAEAEKVSVHAARQALLAANTDLARMMGQLDLIAPGEAEAILASEEARLPEEADGADELDDAEALARQMAASTMAPALPAPAAAAPAPAPGMGFTSAAAGGSFKARRDRSASMITFADEQEIRRGTVAGGLMPPERAMVERGEHAGAAARSVEVFASVFEGGARLGTVWVEPSMSLLELREELARELNFPAGYSLKLGERTFGFLDQAPGKTIEQLLPRGGRIEVLKKTKR